MSTVAAEGRGWLVPVAALFVATVAVITTQSIVPGLLPQLAADLGVDIPTAGLLITGFALASAVAGPVLALMTGGMSRKRLLLAALSVFIVGNALSAVSTQYGMLLAARIVVACSHGLIFGLATVLATQLAPEGRKTSAVSLVIAGSTVAGIAGIPLGIIVGDAFGWRVTFWGLAATGALVWMSVWLLVPSAGKQSQQNFATQLRAAARPGALVGYGVFCFYMFSNMTIFSYIAPLLTEASGVPPAMIPWVISGMGTVGLVGNLVGGRLADRWPMATMMGIVAFVAAITVVMVLVTGSAWGMVIAIWARWMVGFGFPAPLRARVLRDAAGAETLASTLTTTASNVGTGVAAAVGAAAIASGWGYASLLPISIAATTVAFLGLLVLRALDNRQTPAPA
jgi:MFS transporter, DHA1 family, inner membrane transport protein